LGIDELLDGGQGATFYRHDVVGLMTNVGYPGTALDITITYEGLDRRSRHVLGSPSSVVRGL